MIKDVVTLSGQPPVLTSQLDAETSVDSPDIFATLRAHGSNALCY